MSGMTRSMPNISSSGNIRPQSMTTISSPYSKTYMFLPISPTPPSGMMRSGVSLVAGFWLVMASREERQLVGLGWMGCRIGRRIGRLLGDGMRWRRGCRSAGPALAELARLDEGGGDPGDVREARRLDGRRPQRGRRVVHGEDAGAGRAGRGIDVGDDPMRPADRRSRHEPAHRVPAEGHHEGRIEHLELASKVRRTGRDLVGLWVPVVGRPALHDLSLIHISEPTRLGM